MTISKTVFILRLIFCEALSIVCVISDMSDLHSTYLHVLVTGHLTKLLALVYPKSFSLMTSPPSTSLPILDSVASDILDTSISAGKEICHNKKTKFLRQYSKTRVTEDQVNSAAFEIKATLQGKLQVFQLPQRICGVSKEGGNAKGKEDVIYTSVQLEREAECVDTQKDEGTRVQSMTVTVRTLLK